MGISITHVDTQGYSPKLEAVGEVYQHFRSGGRYTITGFSFNAEYDVWQYEYLAMDPKDETVYNRTPRNFHETMSIGVERFNLVGKTNG